MATPKEREEKRKEERQREFDRQVDTGSLVVRQMTDEEHETTRRESPRKAKPKRGAIRIAALKRLRAALCFLTALLTIPTSTSSACGIRAPVARDHARALLRYRLPSFAAKGARPAATSASSRRRCA